MKRKTSHSGKTFGTAQTTTRRASADRTPERASLVARTFSRPANHTPHLHYPPDASPKAVRIPPILWEGDERAETAAAGPGEKFSLGAASVPEGASGSADGELPEAYGTGRLWLQARDPRCLYAHWDLTREQLARYAAPAGRLVVRVQAGGPGTGRLAELEVRPETRHCFVPVSEPGGTYVGELGYYDPPGQWRAIAVSDPVTTPRVVPPAEATSARWATVPTPSMAALPSGSGLGPAQAPSLERSPPSRFPVQRLRRPPNLAFLPIPALSAELDIQTEAAWEPPLHIAPPLWTDLQELALAEVVGSALLRHEWMDSAAIADLIRPPARQGEVLLSEEPLPGPFVAAAEQELPLAPLEVSSPAGGEMPAPPGFWFNVNAELVIYGATSPDARVALGRRPIRLRPDGTFSYHFALPDGVFELPISAVSVQGDERRVELRILRETRCHGAVGEHPREPALPPPLPENAS